MGDLPRNVNEPSSQRRFVNYPYKVHARTLKAPANGKVVNSLLPNGQTRLSVNAAMGNLNSVKDLMSLGSSMHVCNSDGTKPIHVAAVYGHSSVVGYFLRRGMDVDSYDDNTCTPLHYAAKKNSLEVVKLLVRSGANVNCEGPSKMKPMHYAAIHGHVEIVRYLFDMKAEFDARNSDGHTPLLLAAVHAKRAVVDFLVVAGAYVDHFVVDKWTVLHHAALNGWTEIARHLVARGAQLNNKTVCGQTALLLATRNFHESIVSLLIEAGADLECDSDEDKWNVLHHASYLGWVGIVRLLVNRATDLDAQTSRGETAILLAAKMGNAEIVNLLLQGGADFKCQTDQNWNMLHFAADRGWADLVKFLLKNGFDIEATTCQNETPLLLACASGSIEAVDYLMKMGAYSGNKYSNGKMAFSYFIQDVRNLEAVRVFVENGAYLEYDKYCMLVSGSNMLKQGLQNSKICTHAVLNKFNNKDLPELYKLPISVCLPPIERLTIVNNQEVTERIRQDVENEIQTKGICNVNKICPMVLSMMCVKTLLDYSKGELKIVPKKSTSYRRSKRNKLKR